MNKHKSNGNKPLGAILILLVGMLGIGVVSSPAKAAACPYPVENQAANDNPQSNIRLISPSLTDDNSIRRYDFESMYTINCDWFGVGMRYNQVYVPFGLKTNLTYHVADSAGVPLIDTLVTLRVNKGYSNSNAAVRVNGIKARPAPSNASDGANIRAKTDINGNVTFVVASPDDCEAYGGVLPPAPANALSDTPNDRNADPTTDCFTQIMPSIFGEKQDSTDWVELHYFNSSNLNYEQAPGMATLQVPSLGDTNSITTSALIQAYTPVGEGQVVSYSFTNFAGDYLRNRNVQVRLNAEGSGANAQVGAGIFGPDGYGNEIRTSISSSSQLVLSGVTDAFGTFTFFLKNSDLTGETKPASMTSPVQTGNQKYSSVVPEVAGSLTVAKKLELHYVSGLKVPGQSLSAPSNVTVSAEGLTVTVSWINDPDNQGLTRNDVYDSNDNLVCSTGEVQSCSFELNLYNFQQGEKYYVVPSTDTTSGPASSFSAEFTPSTSKPVLFGPAKNFSVGDTTSLLALGFPANSVVYLRDGTQNIQYRTNPNGALTISYEIWKRGITNLSLRSGNKTATLKLYSPRDRISIGFCKVGSSMKVYYSALLPNSTVEVQISDGRDAIYATADEMGNALVSIDCLQVGGYLWTSTVGPMSLNSGGFSVR